MLSSQTKDEVTSEAVKNLRNGIEGGLTPENLSQANVDTVDQLIKKVGFHKKKAENIVSFYESGADPKEVIPAYQKTLTKGLIELSIDSSETLNMFYGEYFNNTINQYQRLDKEWTNISQKENYNNN